MKVKYLVNFSKALYRMTYHVLKGSCPFLTRTKRDVRLSICQGCKFLDSKQNRCTDCGCFVVLKTWCTPEDCPKKFWPPNSLGENYDEI